MKQQPEDGHNEGRDSQPFEPPSNPTPDPPNPSSAAHGEALAAEQGQQGLTDWQIIKQLGAYVWPADNPEYRWRVVGASVLLVGAKGLNVTVCLCFPLHALPLQETCKLQVMSATERVMSTSWWAACNCHTLCAHSAYTLH